MKKVLSQILKENLKRKKTFTYDDLVDFAHQNYCKEDTIRRQLEPDRNKNFKKVYNSRGIIIAWKRV